MGRDCRMRFKSVARFVPRCGVARNVIAEIALMMDSYSGSFWPWMYACHIVSNDSSRYRIGAYHLFDNEASHAVDDEHQWYLAPVVRFDVGWTFRE